MAVLAAGQAHHHPVALLDHAEVGDRLAHLAADALRELVFLVVDFSRVAHARKKYQMKIERPPSTATICPVTYGAQARKCTAWAMSSGVPMRPSGVVFRMRCLSSFSSWPSSGQAIAPGATAFTRTSGASSRASDRVGPASPAFATL